ncbi:unnamed protein product [Linum trigynum]|uniref:CCHC-type domain-containing protein n=1 Tax=Linum trigynum TaxID=586398 RepID=A0AAV2FX18_9ROSI
MQSTTWNLGNTLVSLKKWDGEQKAEAIDIQTVTLRVQMHDLPQSLKDEESIQAVADFIFLYYYGIDQSNFDFRGWLKFIRVKVEVELDKPVPIGFEYPLGERSIRVSFKYERIVDLCYFCGRLGHPIQNCLDREDHRRRGLNTDPSEVYTTALKAGHDSPANTPPLSFREKQAKTRQMERADTRAHCLRGSSSESSLMSIVGRTGQGSASCPPGFAALESNPPATMRNNEWIQRGVVRSPTLTLQTDFMEEEMEAATIAMQRSLDLTGGEATRSRQAGLIEMGQSLSLASPSLTQAHYPQVQKEWANQQAQIETIEQNPIATMESLLAQAAEEIRPRPEKKRKPEKRDTPTISLPLMGIPTNLSMDYISFSPGGSRKTYQRRRQVIRRRSIAEINADGEQSGEGESTTPKEAEASLKPPLQE